MKTVYEVIGITKQAMSKYRKREQKKLEMSEQVIQQIKQIRKHHRRMGCRRMYYATSEPMPVGRDLFEQIGFAHGFKLRRKRKVIRTTWGQRVEVYPNIIEGMILTGTNQLWQSDIFHLYIERESYYGFTIEDVYSRQLLALHLSKSYQAEQLTKTFKKALQATKGSDLTGCIFHSDRGSQYISNAHKGLLKEYGMKISMGKLPQENAYVERLQGTLKHEYLLEFKLTQANLHSMCKKIIHYYNFERPHSELKMVTPEAFHIHQQKLPEKEREKLRIHRGFAMPLEQKNAFINDTAKSDQLWKSGKNNRLFSKDVFPTSPQHNSNNNCIKNNKNQVKTS